GSTQIETPGVFRPYLIANNIGCGRKEHIRCNGRNDQTIDLRRINAPSFTDLLNYRHTKIGSRLSNPFEYPPLLYARSGTDPFVIGVYKFFEISIGQTVFGYVSSDRSDRGGHFHAHYVMKFQSGLRKVSCKGGEKYSNLPLDHTRAHFYPIFAAMIAFLRGVFVFKSPALVHLEAGGVGYELQISLHTYSRIEHLENGVLLTYLHIREDAHILYGFFDRTEKDL